MRLFFLILSVLYCTTSCTNQRLSYMEVVSKYYNAKDSADYNAILSCIDDSLTIAEGDYVMTYTHEGFYEIFKWDSTFSTSYEIGEVVEEGDQVIVTVSSSSARFEFLKNNPLTCKHKLSFNERKIAKIETLDCPRVNWTTWQNERDSLVSWININHPELDGFIHDMTVRGASNYLKAIELYERNKVTR